MAAEDKREFLWRGNIEWKYLVKTTILRPETKLIPCGMACQSKTDEDGLNTGSWSKTLSLWLMPKHAMVDIMMNHVKCSKIVRFYMSNSDASQNLAKFISSKYVGCLHLSHESEQKTSDIEIILLLYAAAKNAYVGLIPTDQIKFIDDLIKLPCFQDHTDSLHERIQDQNIENSDTNHETIVTPTEHPTVATKLQEFKRTSNACKRKFVEDDTDSTNISNTTDAETVIVSKDSTSSKRKKLNGQSSTPKVKQKLTSNEKLISHDRDQISKVMNEINAMCSTFSNTSDNISNECSIKDSVDARQLLVAVAKCKSLIQKTRKDLDKFDEVLNSASKNLHQIIVELSSTESDFSTDLDEVENSEKVERITHKQPDLYKLKIMGKITHHQTKLPNLVNESPNIIKSKRLQSESVSPTMILSNSRPTKRLRTKFRPQYLRIVSSESEQSDTSQDSPVKARSKAHASTDDGLIHNSNKLNENGTMLQRRLRKNPRRLEGDATTSRIASRLGNKKQLLNETLSLSPTSTLSKLSDATAESCSTSGLNVSTEKTKVPETEANETLTPQFYELDPKLRKKCQVVLERLERQSTVELVDTSDRIGHDTNKITPSVLSTQNGCGTSDELPGQCSIEVSSNVTTRKHRRHFLAFNNVPLTDSKSCDTGKSGPPKNPQKKQDEIAEPRVCYQQESLTDITNAKSANPDDTSRFSLRVKSTSTKNVTRDSNSECGVSSKLFEPMTTSVDQETNDQNSISNVKPAVLMLELGKDSKRPFVTVHPALAEGLKPHQVRGVTFMWNRCVNVENVENTDAFGCILAHCTGSGKTFQVIALTHTLWMHPDIGVKRVMIVCPLSVIPHWIAEYETRLKHVNSDKKLNVYRIKKLAQSFSQLMQLQTWHENGGVMVVSFNMFKRLTAEVEQSMTRNLRKTIVKCLIDPGPDLVVCDEGHMLKSEDSNLSRSLSRVKTLRRIVLTNKLLQDHFSKYHCMMKFATPNHLGTKEEFSVEFVKPIINGQFADSSEDEVMFMESKFRLLCKMLECSVQRFDYSVLTSYLPPKQEYVISIRLTKIQMQLYRYCINNITRQKSNETFYLDYQALQKIWTHPSLLPMIYGILKKKNIARWNNFSIKSESSIDSSVSENVQSPSQTNLQTDYPQIEEDIEFPPVKRWWTRFVKPRQLKEMRLSSKLQIFFAILNKSEKVGDKVLFLSESFRALSLVEKFLSQMPQARNPDNSTSQWVAGSDYFRLDRHTTMENKRRYCQIFNDPEKSRARLFLVSTQAIMLGINFTGANRVVLFDAGRNPLHDVENILKVYRLDQTKPCYVYRLLSHGTMEEKIYNSQFTGLRLSSEVYDQQQRERFYKNHDLAELYRFEPNTDTNENTLNTPRDSLLAQILVEHKDLIDSCHEFDSLLENRIYQIMQGFKID